MIQWAVTADSTDWFVVCYAGKMTHEHFSKCAQVNLLTNGEVVQFLFRCAVSISSPLFWTTQRNSQRRLSYQVCFFGMRRVVRGNTADQFDFGTFWATYKTSRPICPFYFEMSRCRYVGRDEDARRSSHKRTCLIKGHLHVLVVRLCMYQNAQQNLSWNLFHFDV